MFGSETVAWRDADYAVLGDKEAEEWDLRFRVANTVSTAVEHQEYGKAVGQLRSRIGSRGFEDDDSRHVAVAYGNVVDCFRDIFGTS